MFAVFEAGFGEFIVTACRCADDDKLNSWIQKHILKISRVIDMFKGRPSVLEAAVVDGFNLNPCYFSREG